VYAGIRRPAFGGIDNDDIDLAMDIALLVVDGALDFGLSALHDTLGVANLLAGEPLFRVRRVSVRARVRTAQGLPVPTDRAVADPAPDVALVPALGAITAEPLLETLARPDIAAAGRVLRAWADAGTLLGAACTATFVLAEAGVLDDHAATTSWWLGPVFRQRYPRVRLDADHMVVPSGRRVTGGGAVAHIDLALWLIRQSRPELAALTARYLVIDPRPSQATWAIPDHLEHADPIVERFEAWARENLGERFSLQVAAKRVGTSPRTLERRVHRVLGRSPGAFVQDLRVERALHLLRTSDQGVDAIAEQVGYQDGVTLRNLIRRKTGRGVRELRPR
jgi:transcriptional regulator GlxA family with amidase domain